MSDRPETCTFCPVTATETRYAPDNNQVPVCEDCYNWEPFYVNVYTVGQCYGGAEEGGWWFLSGEPISSVLCDDWDESDNLRDELRKKFKRSSRRSSVLPDYEDYEVYCERHFARPFPEARPHYE